MTKTPTTVKQQVLGISAPPRASDSQHHDKNCPFTGTLAVKNELIQGRVIKRDASKSATIEWFRPFYVPKYERFENRRSRIRVHNPPAIDAQVGQTVLVARTRPLSKTKHHVILAVLDGTVAAAGSHSPSPPISSTSPSPVESSPSPRSTTGTSATKRHSRKNVSSQEVHR